MPKQSLPEQQSWGMPHLLSIPSLLWGGNFQII